MQERILRLLHLEDSSRFRHLCEYCQPIENPVLASLFYKFIYRFVITFT